MQTVITGTLSDPGPAESGFLIHFTGRPPGRRPNAGRDPRIAAMTPEERLSSILWDGVVRSTVPFGATQHAVSLSEASPAHVSWLVRAHGFPEWGVMFGRQAVYDAGGGPVWYARPEQWRAVRGTPAAEWAVRYETTPSARSDWTHEQEWRLHGAALDLRQVVPIGVLVGDPAWEPIREFRQLVGTDGLPVDDPSRAATAVPCSLVPRLPSWPLRRYVISPETGSFLPVALADT